jgi:DNA topoisomerase VI subunit B
MNPRTTFTTSRLLEFCSRKELVAQTGAEPDAWPMMLVKELVDNALDACEEAGIAPMIRVTVARGMIRVRDNAGGIPAETVASILDFSTRTSSREAYVAPDRGRQGNALKTILAMPFALSGEEGKIEIEARGIRHAIAFRVDRIAQQPVIDHEQRRVSVRTGTSITVHWPDSSRSELQKAGAQFLPIVQRFTDLNPHLAICATWQDEDRRERWSRDAESPGWTKWTPSAPTCPHWYRVADLERLAGAFLHHDRQHKAVRLLRDFLAEFNGLSGTAKRKAVLDAVGLPRAPLARLLTDGEDFDQAMVNRLLVAMQDAARPIKPLRLGPLGREVLERTFAAYEGDPETFRYKLLQGVDDGVPWVVETAFAYRPKAHRRVLVCGVNWSPSLDADGDPFRLGYQLGTNWCDTDAPIVLLVHLICPRPEFLDRGKTSLAHHSPGYLAVREAVEHVTADWAKQRKGEIKDARREAKRLDAMRRHHARRISIKDAAWRVLPDAYDKASSNGKYPALARQIYYAARPKILDLTDKDTLDANYFSYTLLPLFIKEHDLTRRWRVHFKPRGTLTEPHTGRKIPLGTDEVDQYQRAWKNGGAAAVEYLLNPWSPKTCGPHNRFAGILTIEKEGFADLLVEIGIGRKYDVAIIGNEGQSVEAELALADALQLPLFILHDFDRTGLTIAENLRSGTWRHRYANRFPVVDVGLRLHQVDGLEDEPISADNLKSVGDDRLRECGATEAEIAFLRRRRVELNAMTTEQMVEIVEAAFAEHGIAKVIPGADELEAAWRSAKAYAEIALAIEKANKKTARWRDKPAPKELADQMRALLDKDPSMAWDAALLRIVEARR